MPNRYPFFDPPRFEAAPPPRPFLRYICFGVAAFCFGWAGFLFLDQYLHQQEAGELFKQSVRAAKRQPASINKNRKRIEGPIAKLEISRLDVSGFVEDGFDAATLQRAIGHLPESARPGEPGNIVMAAHRDTFFAGLRGVRVGDVIQLQAVDGRAFRYAVSKVFVVSRDDPSAMEQHPPQAGGGASQSLLTLITCYPFHYIGNAPDRFVVQARPIEARGYSGTGKAVIWRQRAVRQYPPQVSKNFRNAPVAQGMQ